MRPLPCLPCIAYWIREMASLSRWASDVTMRTLGIEQSENNTDPKFTIGSVGMSRPENVLSIICIMDLP